ncbi:hypothetical protein SOCE26_100120 [Sorangium cellulosum]|uniref:Uncharacterized protein n=1 Tax=Sorangium cellulosum TaxID=56 RepID=A0A2L0FA85_SORCE|nr:hypothetical protein [Sorangium cellulosum]AUX48474.1 hypothetical protein SOCE26_100120 [Sorangium cellulosum]
MASAGPDLLAALPAARRGAASSAFLWSRGRDLAVFGGSAAAALAIAALSAGGELPAWGFLLFVVGVDVAHVHTTLFRTYLDREELRRHPALYAGVPLACYAAGVALHLASELTFWRALAYAAVIHFVRQQIGWAAIYRALAGERARLDRALDDALIYAATGWPLLYWHTCPPRAFRWFVDGDFVSAPWLAAAVGPLGAVYAALAAAYVARVIHRACVARAPLNLGKHVVVATTAATWYVGIVATNSDLQFTVTNVVVHGVPYMALLYTYGRERAGEVPGSLLGRLLSGGLLAFLGLALALAFAEEMLWDRLVWHDRPELFGGAAEEPLLGPLARALLVPLLALPQATHYALDAVIWRRRHTGPAQARALGFGPGRSAGAREAPRPCGEA